MTIKQIADLCGVSRGTVDRVLNERGKVKPETQERVLKAIAQLGYTKNIAGKALTLKKNISYHRRGAFQRREPVFLMM